MKEMFEQNYMHMVLLWALWVFIDTLECKTWHSYQKQLRMLIRYFKMPTLWKKFYQVIRPEKNLDSEKKRQFKACPVAHVDISLNEMIFHLSAIAIQSQKKVQLA